MEHYKTVMSKWREKLTQRTPPQQQILFITLLKDTHKSPFCPRGSALPLMWEAPERLTVCNLGRERRRPQTCIVKRTPCPPSLTLICLLLLQGCQRRDFWWQRQAALLQRESSLLGKWHAQCTPTSLLPWLSHVHAAMKRLHTAFQSPFSSTPRLYRVWVIPLDVKLSSC